MTSKNFRGRNILDMVLGKSNQLTELPSTLNVKTIPVKEILAIEKESAVNIRNETIKGTEKQCKKTIKETVKTTKHLLRKIFESNLLKFMQHLANIHNQFKAIRFIKQNISPSDGLLHIDFSENYACKYSSEVQSAHFGGSKGQLSLHTCVYYRSNFQPPENLINTTSFCTVSENTRHDPVLICAHLKPVLDRIILLSPELKELHILSDGPTTQYRNKTMFHMIVNFISKISNADRIIWHFGEAGHGKTTLVFRFERLSHCANTVVLKFKDKRLLKLSTESKK